MQDNTLHFQLLDILLHSSQYSLIDDGLVPDIDAHSKKLCELWNVDITALNVFQNTNAQGRYLSALFLSPDNSVIKEEIRIFCKSGNSYWDELFYRGHEETHALHLIDRIGILEDRLRMHGLNIDLRRYSDYKNCPDTVKEIVAHIGGLCVLAKSGYDFNRLPLNAAGNEFRTASLLFMMSRYEKYEKEKVRP